MFDNIEFLDDDTRPEVPTFTGLSASQRAGGEHLAAIHSNFRRNMKVIRQSIDDAKSGKLTSAQVREQFEDLDMMKNLHRFGNLCGQHCMMLDMHHSIEDQSLFPRLRNKSEVLKKVVDRLGAEHKVVHALLVSLSSALQALADNPGPAAFADADAVYTKLEAVLLSHFSYEEKSIGDALGYYNIL